MKSADVPALRNRQLIVGSRSSGNRSDCYTLLKHPFQGVATEAVLQMGATEAKMDWSPSGELAVAFVEQAGTRVTVFDEELVQLRTFFIDGLKVQSIRSITSASGGSKAVLSSNGRLLSMDLTSGRLDELGRFVIWSAGHGAVYGRATAGFVEIPL